MSFLVYLHTCNITGKSYVGLTSKTIEQRWNDHVYNAGRIVYNTKKFRRFYFQNAIAKYGIENWAHKILQENIETLEEASKIEIFWIQYLNTLYPHGYNQTLGGSGIKMSDDVKLRHSLATSAALQEPEVKMRHLIGVRKSHNTKEFLEKNRILQKDAQNRADVKHKKSNSMKNWYAKGNKSPTAKQVYQLTLENKIITKFESVRQASLQTGVHYTNIIAVCKLERNKAGGYIWKYAESDN